MSKIQRTSKIINVILSVMFWCTIIVLGVAAVTMIITLIGKSASGIESESSLILGNYKLTLTEGYDWKNIPVTIATDISIILTAVFACYEIKVLKDIFKPMANGLPFNNSVSKSIRKVAWIELAYGIISIVVEIVMNTLIYKSLDIPSLFSPDKVSDCSISIVSDGSFIALFVLLILLSHVFQYGEELQKLSDETL